MTSVLDTKMGATPPVHPLLVKLVGSSAPMQRLLAAARRVASSNAPVLIEGETGTGKELVARFIHVHSRRHRGTFVPHNCAATPDSLIESELFGHVRGAFTGAQRDRRGLFATTEGGTLLLDEVGDVSPLMQIKLLRVLQEGEYRRVGESRARRVDFRLIAATNKALEQEVRSRRFRADLYYRLHVVHLELPPLRARPGDIAELADHFSHRVAAEEEQTPVRLTSAALGCLERYRWPGNVRELENEVRRLAALWPGGEIGLDRLSPRVRAAMLEEPAAEEAGGGDLRSAVVRLERGMIADALVRTGGNKSRTARDLGLSRQGLAKKMRRYGMRWAVPESPGERDAAAGA